ncbi:MAG TPA: Xaa-Pro peptidase family protein [Chloroflexota bacterium]|nr:Xaa-Pro peptidase family protein [Chloroflexota bacterium]
MGATWAAGQFNVDFEQRVDQHALRVERVEKARQAMHAAELDALLVWKDENQRYLTGLRAQLIAGKSTSLNGALLIGDEDPILFCSGGEADRVRATMPWIKELHVVPIVEQRALVDAFVAETLVPILERFNLTGGIVGMDEANMILVQAMQRALPNLTLQECDSVMQGIRAIKLPGEIALIQEATAIADAVTQTGMEAVRAGRRECEVAGDAMQTLYHLGGEYSHVTTPFVASGEHMSPPYRQCTDKIIRNGDIVFIDIGAAANGYFGDVARATICGTPSRRQKEIHTAVYESLQAGIALMRPGHTNVEVRDAMLAAADRYGLAGHFLSLFIGHGVGAGANEPPYVGETLPGAPTYEFQPGMVFAMEPLIWVPDVRGGGGVRLEEMVLITDGEAHVMSRAPFDERLFL